MITIIHGPPASGKTFHKQAFAKKFGCTHIVEEWDPHRHTVPEDGRLCLTLADLEDIGRALRLDQPDCEVRILDITTARHLIGVAPHAPTIAERLSR